MRSKPRAAQLSKFSDSVWCMGRISEEHPKAYGRRNLVYDLNQCRELDRVHGEPMEFEHYFLSIHNIAESRREHD